MFIIHSFHSRNNLKIVEYKLRDRSPLSFGKWQEGDETDISMC